MSITPQRLTYQLAFEITPIILTRGIAAQMGGALPIVLLTEGANFLTSLITGDAGTILNKMFAHFRPVPGASIIRKTVGTYPLANQTVAANAIISQPKTFSLRMTCPAQPQPLPAPAAPGAPGLPKLPSLPTLPTLGGINLNPQAPASGSLTNKLMTMLALQNAIEQHCNMGGTFTVLMPSFIYVDALLTDLRCVDGQEGNAQPQVEWQWDFFQPLISAQAVQATQNGLIQKITSGAAIGGTPTWLSSGFALGTTNPINLIINSLTPIPTQAPTVPLQTSA